MNRKCLLAKSLFLGEAYKAAIPIRAYIFIIEVNQKGKESDNVIISMYIDLLEAKLRHNSYLCDSTREFFSE